MTIRWVNHVVISAPRNGTTTHTVDPNGGTVASGTNFVPTSGRLLVCIAYGGVTSTTPSGWTLPTNGSAINNGGLYVWYRTAAGSDTLSTTHNGTNYALPFEVFEFPAGSTFKGSATATGVNFSGGAGPTLSGMTGTTQYFATVGQNLGGSTAGAVTWSAGTEIADTSLAGSPTDGYTFGTAYLDDSAATSWSSAATTSGVSSNSTERLVFGVGAATAAANTTAFFTMF